MANNYTESSFMVTMRDKKERDGVLGMLSDLAGMFSVREEDAEVSEYEWPTFAVTDLYDAMDVSEYGIGFITEPDGEDGIWVHADESINVEQCAEFFGWVMRHFALPEPISFMWADYCSKPRLGEQGGGAVFITQEVTQWMSTYSWIHGKEEEHKRLKEIGDG